MTNHFRLCRKTFPVGSKRSRFLLYMLLCLMMTSSFQEMRQAVDAKITIRFKAYIHGEPFLLNKKYQNLFGESFTISRFRFYAGKFMPVYTDPRIKTNPSTLYQLIDFSDISSTSFQIHVAGGASNGIQFQLGIDSTDQNQGAQSGTMDPVNGMFWTWNNGYLCFKIEGSSPASTQPAHLFAYHIGGYRYPHNTTWKIKINTTDDELFHISPDNTSVVEVPVELSYFFDGQLPLHIHDIPNCSAPGELARKISENFIGIFTSLKVTPTP